MSRRKVWKQEYRTKRALAIDRSINAKKRYGDFNDDYRNSPNRSDVEDYDDIKMKRKVRGYTPKSSPVPRSNPEPKHSPVIERNNDTGGWELGIPERTEAVMVFLNLPLEQQRDDLMENSKRVMSREDFNDWKRNPEGRDIVGVDSVPKGLYNARVEVLKNELSEVPFELSNRRTNAGGGFASFPIATDTGSVMIYPKSRTFEGFKRDLFGGDEELTFGFIAGHELGHALDRNRVAKTTLKYGNYKGETKDWEIRTTGAADVFYGDDWINGGREDLKKSATLFNPIPENADWGFISYRTGKNELFADSVGALVVNPKKVKQVSPMFVSKFESKFPSIVSGWKESDLKITDSFIGGLKKQFNFKGKKGGLL